GQRIGAAERVATRELLLVMTHSVKHAAAQTATNSRESAQDHSLRIVLARRIQPRESKYAVTIQGSIEARCRLLFNAPDARACAIKLHHLRRIIVYQSEAETHGRGLLAERIGQSGVAQIVVLEAVEPGQGHSWEQNVVAQPAVYIKRSGQSAAAI